MHGCSGSGKIPGRERIRNCIVYKKILILLLIICAGNSFELSAYNNFHSINSDHPVVSDQPGALETERNGQSSPDDKELTNLSHRYDLPVPEPYKDFKIDLLRDKSPWPPYLSIDGVYKIDCVYIKGFD